MLCFNFLTVHVIVFDHGASDVTLMKLIINYQPSASFLFIYIYFFMSWDPLVRAEHGGIIKGSTCKIK